MDLQWINGTDSVAEMATKSNVNFNALTEGVGADITEVKAYADTVSTTAKTEAITETQTWAKGTFSNPNLLIGGDFSTNPWQRGMIFTPSSGFNYTADRWVMSQGVLNGAKAEKVTKGLKLSCLTSITGSYARIEQRGEKNAYLRSYFDGNNDIAISAKINGVIYSGIINTANSNIGVVYAVGSLFNGSFGFGISTQNTTNYDYRIVIDNYNSVLPLEIEWVKLELGSVATPFVPRPYGEELALCQRYYINFGMYYGTTGFATASAATNSIAIYINTPTPSMRAVPTVSYSATNVNNFIVSPETGKILITGVSVLSIIGGVARCLISFDGSIPAYTVIGVLIIGLTFDAEI